MARCRWLECGHCASPQLLAFNNKIIVAEELLPPTGGWWARNIHKEGARYVADCSAVADLGEKNMDQAACWIKPYPSEILAYISAMRAVLSIPSC